MALRIQNSVTSKLTSLSRWAKSMVPSTSSLPQPMVSTYSTGRMISLENFRRFSRCIDLQQVQGQRQSGDSEIGPKWVRLSLNGDKSGTFHIRFQYILGCLEYSLVVISLGPRTVAQGDSWSKLKDMLVRSAPFLR